ncbi:hypothetical protein [Komagataeibacter rhaeticus]|uniref:hypothetical protein n=2 Tax=Komagataeibacter TaxID=1434011 RepID=UPI00054DEAF4|nr:hypothetical protein [Komagataeibacter rhaeticus]
MIRPGRNTIMETGHSDREAEKNEATRRALAQADAGLFISGEAVKAWAASLGTDHPLPLPEPGQ